MSEPETMTPDQQKALVQASRLCYDHQDATPFAAALLRARAEQVAECHKLMRGRDALLQLGDMVDLFDRLRREADELEKPGAHDERA